MKFFLEIEYKHTGLAKDLIELKSTSIKKARKETEIYLLVNNSSYIYGRINDDDYIFSMFFDNKWNDLPFAKIFK